MLLTQQKLPAMCEISYEFFYLSGKQFVNSISAHSLSVSVSYFGLLNERHPRLFHQDCESNTQI